MKKMTANQLEGIMKRWAPGVVVYFPGTCYDGTVRAGFEGWRTVSRVDVISGTGCDGSPSWLLVTFTDGHESSPYWLRRIDARLPGEEGYVPLPGCDKGSAEPKGGVDDDAVA